MKAGELHRGEDGLRCVRSGFWGFNSIGLVHGGEALVVDPGLTPGEIDTLAGSLDAPVGQVVLTHSHHDHIRGWQRFRGASVVMPRVAADKRPEARKRILAAKQWLDGRLEVEDPDFAYPAADRTFEKSSSLHVGELGVELRFLPGHSDCTSIVWIPELRTVLSADYLVEPGLPYCRWRAREFEEACATLQAFCEENDVQRVVPSHNDWLHGGDSIRAAIGRERRYFELLRAAICEARDEGLPREQAEKLGVAAVRGWRSAEGQDVGRRERQDDDNAGRVAEEEYAARGR